MPGWHPTNCCRAAQLRVSISTTAAKSRPRTLREAALTAEDAGRAIAGVTNSQGASASGGRSVTALATSHGFAAAYAGLEPWGFGTNARR